MRMLYDSCGMVFQILQWSYIRKKRIETFPYGFNWNGTRTDCRDRLHLDAASKKIQQPKYSSDLFFYGRIDFFHRLPWITFIYDFFSYSHFAPTAAKCVHVYRIYVKLGKFSFFFLWYRYIPWKYSGLLNSRTKLPICYWHSVRQFNIKKDLSIFAYNHFASI